VLNEGLRQERQWRQGLKDSEVTASGSAVWRRREEQGQVMLSPSTIKAIKQSGHADRICNDLSTRLDGCIKVLAGSTGEILFRAQGEYAILKQLISEIKE
jgi:3-dehydroquinate synthase class II